MERRTITIDNGGSELRYIAGVKSTDIKCMDKNIRMVDGDMFRVKESVEEFDIVKIIEAPQPEYVGLYATGVGYYMYEGVDITMNNQKKKSNSLSWYQQLLIAIATDAIKHLRNNPVPDTPTLEVEEELEGAEEMFDLGDFPKVEIPSADYEYILTTLIPVQEHSGNTDYASKLKGKLHGRYVVEFPAIVNGVKRVTFLLDKNKIGVVPEGVVAIMSLKDIGASEYTLIVDMGHVTTDLSLCKGKHLIGNSVVSSSYAGSTLLKLIMSVIRDYGCMPNEEIAVNALQTNKFNIGKKEIEISKGVDTAKKIFVSNYIKSEILNMIELSGITPQSIQYVLPIGAVLGTPNPDTKEFDILKSIIQEVGLENAEVKLISDSSLRYVNVEKAARMCDAFEKRV